MEVELVTFENGALSLVKKMKLEFLPVKEQCYFDSESKIWYYIAASYFTDEKNIVIVKKVEAIEERRILLAINTYLEV